MAEGIKPLFLTDEELIVDMAGKQMGFDFYGFVDSMRMDMEMQEKVAELALQYAEEPALRNQPTPQ